MAREELPKVYEPGQVEAKIYKMWEDGGYFRPSDGETAKCKTGRLNFLCVSPSFATTHKIACKKSALLL